MNRLSRRTLLGGAGAMLVASPLAPAFAQIGFPAGATIEVLSSGSDGSGSGTLFQALCVAMERASPSTRFVFRPNSGGSAAMIATLLAESAPDGLTIGGVDIDSLIAKFSGEQDYDVTDFAIIGSLARDIDLLFASTASGLASVEDLKSLDEPAILPVRSTSSGSYFQGLMLNAALGTRILPVTGYDSGARDLAFFTGEADVSFLGFDTALKAVADGTGVPLLKTANIELPEELAGLPALTTFDLEPQYRWVAAYLDAAVYTDILACPKSTPPDRIAALREIFMRAVSDPDLVAIAAPITILDPVPGDRIEAGIDDMIAGIDSFATGLTAALDCGRHRAETGEACAN